MSRLLIVNANHHEFKCVPIGSFGICDYLGQRDLAARIINLALYDRSSYLARLEAEILEFRPTLIGLVIHWKELLENALYVAFFIRSRFPEITIVAGGLTAGYLGEDLLRHTEDVDLVVRGDPEATLEALLRRVALPDIPNLIYRDGDTVRATEPSAISKATLDEITFTHVDYLADYELYVAYLERFLGWPLMVGRGCAYNCEYCGGSKKAFQETGDRRGLTLRSTAAIVRDLKVLAEYTDYVFVGNEPSKPHMYRVLEAIAGDPEIAHRFRCGYNTFKLMDARLLDLLPRAFRFTEGRRALFEIAPETTIEEDRAIVRDPALFYTNDELIESVRDTHARIPGARTVIFFSRYHRTHTREKLRQELRNIHELRCRIYELGLADEVTITYCFLSTDVGSANWDQLPIQLGRRRTRRGGTEMLLESIRRYQRGRWPDPPLDGLCMYRPADVDDAFEIEHTRLAKVMDLLLRAGPYYYLLSRAIGAAALFAILELVAARTRTLYLDEQVESHLLELVHEEVLHRCAALAETAPSFFEGLLAVGRGVLTGRHDRDVPLPPVNGEQLVLQAYPLLDPSRVTVVDHDYAAPELAAEIASEPALAPKKPTLFVFCPGKTHRFDARFMSVLEHLDGRTSLGTALERGAAMLETPEGDQFHDFVVAEHLHFTR